VADTQSLLMMTGIALVEAAHSLEERPAEPVARSLCPVRRAAHRHGSVGGRLPQPTHPAGTCPRVVGPRRLPARCDLRSAPLSPLDARSGRLS
jgi:hypothetical protein